MLIRFGGNCKMKKCFYCGREFVTNKSNQIYCSEHCRLKRQYKKNSIGILIDRIAKKHQFDLQNKTKIIRAKMMLFKDGDAKFCPCDSSNPNRYCGSDLCIHDVLQHSHCHCNLYHAKKTLEQYESGE